MASTISSVVAKRKIVEKSPPRSSTSGMDVLTSRTGGAYIPPARLKMMQAKIKDKTSSEFQRIAWEALKKSINGHINKVNVANLSIIVRELFKENLVRGRGLFSRSILQAQAASPTFTHVYAAVVAVINSKFPQIGELILKRLILQFRRGYKRNDKQTCLHSARFIAHLVNQEVAHEVVALELLTLLLENTTNDSVEVAVGFLKEVGKKLSDVSPRGIHSIFERLRNILHEGSRLDRRVQYMIEVMFAIRKDGFKDHPAVISELDLVEESDQFTHLITLDEVADPEDMLNVFKFDPDYEKSEEKYEAIKKEILDEEDSDDGSEASGSDEEEEEESTGPTMIVDNTETNLVELRRTIYLTIQSSLDFEECAHKLLKLELKGKQITELCHMVIDCCAQQRTYFKFFGLLAQRFCSLSEEYVGPFSEIFTSCYDTIHRFETNKLRNVAKLFAHLFFTDSISWILMSHIRLNEDDTTSSSRVFIKILFQELAEYVGLTKLNCRIKDPTLLDASGSHAFDGLFPRDNPRNTRFAINFFTSIGLGGLTDDLREHLASVPKVPILAPITSESVAVASSSDSDSSSESDSSSSSPSSSSSSSSEDEREKRKKYKKSDRGKKARKGSSESPGRKKIKKERTSRSKSRSPKRREETSKRREETSKRREETSKRREETSKRREETSKRREETSKRRREENDGKRLDAGDSRDKKRSGTPERWKRSKDSQSPEHSKRSRRSPRDTDRTERTSSKSPKRSKPKSSKSPKRSKPSKSSKSPKRSKPSKSSRSSERSKSPRRREQSPKRSRRGREERSKERDRSPEVDRRKDSKRHRRDHS